MTDDGLVIGKADVSVMLRSIVNWCQGIRRGFVNYESALEIN